MLNFEGAWRFDSPGEIAAGVVQDLYDFVGKISAQVPPEQRWGVFEHFKRQFCGAANEPYWHSSNASFAVGDLRRDMEKAAANAPLFIEAFYVGCLSLQGQFPNLTIPDVGRINRVLFEHEAGYEISPPDLICRNPHAAVPVPVRPPSFHQQAQEVFQQSLDASETLLAEGHPRKARQAVQEMLWLLETVTTAFRGIDVGQGTIRGKYFNTIVSDLKRHDRGNLKRVLEWVEALDGYLSSPTGGGVRHGADLSGDLTIEPNEARLFCNLIRSYISYLMAEHERLTRAKCDVRRLCATTSPIEHASQPSARSSTLWAAEAQRWVCLKNLFSFAYLSHRIASAEAKEWRNA